MIERELGGVQRLALESAQGLNQAVGGAAWTRQAPGAVFGVTHDGIVQMRQMQANLVRAPGLEFDAEVGMGAETLEHAIMGNRRAAVLAHGHAQAVASMPADRLIDRTASRHHSHAQCEVFSGYRARGELAGQGCVRFDRARHHQKTAGVLVQSMDDAGARHRGQRGVHAQQGILQGVMRIAGSGVHHQSRRLVHHQHLAVFIHQVQGNRFGQHPGRRDFHRHAHLDPRPRAHHVSGLAGKPADQHLTRIDPTLDACARMPG